MLEIERLQKELEAAHDEGERVNTSELISDDKPVLITGGRDEEKQIFKREKNKNRVFKLSDIFAAEAISSREGD